MSTPQIRMKCLPSQPVAARLLGVLLALAMLVGPSVAQVAAAEVCRTRCDPAALAGNGGCCGEHGTRAAEPRSGGTPRRRRRPTPADQPAESDPKFCPGCNGRPLALDTPRADAVTRPAPRSRTRPSAPMTSASFDVPFAIFHPPGPEPHFPGVPARRTRRLRSFRRDRPAPSSAPRSDSARPSTASVPMSSQPSDLSVLSRTSAGAAGGATAPAAGASPSRRRGGARACCCRGESSARWSR